MRIGVGPERDQASIVGLSPSDLYEGEGGQASIISSCPDHSRTRTSGNLTITQSVVPLGLTQWVPVTAATDRLASVPWPGPGTAFLTLHMPAAIADCWVSSRICEGLEECLSGIG